MEKLTRFGVSLDPELLIKFDEQIKQEGYSSRSEAIRDLIREKLVVSECSHPEEEIVGTFTMLYNHDTPGLVNHLIEIQHHCKAKVNATTHIHLDNHYCVEVLLARGKSRDIKVLAASIKSLKGVTHGKLVLTKAV